jgi:sulfate-transporting ATPase
MLAFGFATFLAAMGGILVAFRYPQVDFSQFGIFDSIQVVLLTVMGGIGSVIGAVLAGASAAEGVAAELLAHLWNPTNWFLLLAAGLALLTVVANPNGIAHRMASDASRLLNSLSRLFRRPEATPALARRSDDEGSAQNLAEPSSMIASATEAVLAPRPTSPRQSKGLSIRGLCVHFGGVVALDDVTLDVHPGEVVGLIGPNGAGKTTLIDAASGFVPAVRGQVLLGEQRIDHLPARARAGLGLTRSFQSLELFEDLTVSDNIRVASETRTLTTFLSDLVWPKRRPWTPGASASIGEFRLAPHLAKRPEQLSNAGRRLVAIARSVAASPSVLLLDEPASGLDATSTAELAALVRRLADDWNMAILLVEHDVSMVMDTCDHVVVLDFGRQIAAGPPSEVRRHPAVAAAYLGADLEGKALDRI